MTNVREATDNLLAEKPDLESDLRDVLAVDERAAGWTFDDVPLDSGSFGELVSRDIVAKRDGEYEVADPQAVRASLDGDAAINHASDEGPTLPSLSLHSVSIPSVSRTEAGALGAALAFVLLMRTYIYPSVFRGEYVVLPSNDPYYYRYWVEQLAVESTGVFDFSVLSGLPGAVAKGEPLMVATLWWVTNLLGGADAAGWVLAWYPVVSALVVAVLVYALAARVTGDYRVGLASVALLAVIPAFAYRTGLGFADHHAFDYSWLALTALALVWLADVEREDLSTLGPWFVAGVLGIAVAGQVLAWEAGPLLIGPLGVYVAVRAVVDVRAHRSPLVAATPILTGVTLAAVLSHLAHTGFDWQTDVVAYAPVLLLVGVAGVSLVGEVVHRAEIPGFVLGGAEIVGALGGLALVITFLPSYAEQLSQRVRALLFNSGPAETKSLFAGGPSGFFLGPILELGFAWVLALPMLALASWRAYWRDNPGWLVVCAYGWYFLLLAAFQRRFVGELTPFFAILGGYAFVVLAAKIDVTSLPTFSRNRRPGSSTAQTSRGGNASTEWPFRLPNRSTITALAILLLFVTSAGVVQTAVRHEQVKIDDKKVQASAWMDKYASEQGWEYPENYVLSKWGRNRMYNYFVNGEAKSYAYAKSHYEAFLSSQDPESQYRKLKTRAGFIVTKNLNLNHKVPPESNYARLHKRFGSAGSNGASGAGHYRAVYASDDGSVKVFTLVPGAKIVGNASPGETVTISKQVKIEGKQFVYKRTTKANPYGVFSVTVPYAGEYSVKGATKVVSQGAPTGGEMVKWHDRDGIAHWPFDKRYNKTAFDRVGGHQGTITGAERTTGVEGSGLAFDGENSDRVDVNVSSPSQFTVSLWVKAENLDSANSSYSHLIKSENGPFLILSPSGRISFRVPGVESSNYRAGTVEPSNWTHVAVTYNGSHRTVFVNGQQAGTDQISSGTVDWGGHLRIGSGYSNGGHSFDGAIDEVRIYGRALSADEVQRRYESQNKTAE